MTTQPCFDAECYELAENATYRFPLSRPDHSGHAAISQGGGDGK
ncbi:MAG: hypothetical protein OZ929_18295 [Bryobacterales bacterium]|nr:hypothetical protein [Bryobacterales bacterium]